MKNSIGFGKFIRRCIPGFIATASAPLLWVICFGFSYMGRDGNNKPIILANAELFQTWEDESTEAYIYNLVASDLNGVEATASCIKPQTVECYVQMVSALLRESSAEKRTKAYLEYKGAQTLSDDTTMATYRALNDKDLLPTQRFNMIRKGGDNWPKADHTVESWLAGNKIEQKPMPSTPALTTLWVADWYSWQIFALILGILVMLVMMVGYWKLSEPDYQETQSGNYSSYWALPTHLGSWLIMLFYAPAFLAPWVFRPIFYLVAQSFSALKWLFTGADISVPLTKISDWRAKRQAERLRREAEDQANMQESSRVGSDVVIARMEIQRLRQEVNSLSDQTEREDLLAKLSAVEARLQKVADNRTITQAPGGSLGDRVGELFTRVEVLGEIEDSTPRE